MSDREVDIWALQMLWGVRKIYYGEHDVQKERPQYIPSGKPWRTHSIDAKLVPRFATDAAADYLVLVKVRETWGHEDNQAFVEACKTIWFGRSTSSVALALWLFYEPGDFTRAAYAARHPEEVK